MINYADWQAMYMLSLLAAEPSFATQYMNQMKFTAIAVLTTNVSAIIRYNQLITTLHPAYMHIKDSF